MREMHLLKQANNIDQFNYHSRRKGNSQLGKSAIYLEKLVVALTHWSCFVCFSRFLCTRRHTAHPESVRADSLFILFIEIQALYVMYETKRTRSRIVHRVGLRV